MRVYAPVRIFVVVGLAGLALAVVAVLLVTRQPWLGLDLRLDDTGEAVLIERSEGPAVLISEWYRLEAVEGDLGFRVPVRPTTIIEEPDQLSDFATLDQFRAEQDGIAAAMRSSLVTLHLAAPGGVTRAVTVRPEPTRPIGDLPAMFWVQIIVGFAGMLIGGWVWSLSPGKRPQAFIMLTGVGLAISSTAAAIYSSRELALPALYFQLLGPANLIGSMTFGAGVIGLFLSYPARLGPRWLATAQIGVIALWLVGSFTRAIPVYTFAYQLPIATAMLVLVILVALQFRRARKDKDLPARAALRIFGLSVLLGAGGFVGLVTVPQLLGLEAQVSQGYAFTLFLICYLGLALAVRRHRIFNLDQWAFRILYFAVGALFLVCLDAALIYGLSIERAPALGIALFTVAFLYLPFRDAVARRLARRRGQARVESFFKDISTVALTKDSQTQAQLWDELLLALFQPLYVEAGPSAVQHPQLDGEGVFLIIPAVPPLTARQLKWASNGRRLFSDADVQKADELVDILAQLIESRKAYETGAAEERSRIARDIHDNIGIQLLGALHSQDPRRKDVLIRETLADLREIIDNQTGPGLDLGNLIADLRLELSEILEAAGIDVDWPLGANLTGYNLTPRIAHTMRSVLRECVNNAIRHAGAQKVGIGFDVQQGLVRFRVSDDGRGFDPEAEAMGQGVRNMKVRVSALGGQINVRPAGFGAGRPGTMVLVELPLMRHGVEDNGDDDMMEAAQ
ncbi:MAG: ATP-binding protein [Pseudomonadota bacterium]|nr:ATP-binding protein [Pseudomonadota bacterium]